MAQQSVHIYIALGAGRGRGRGGFGAPRRGGGGEEGGMLQEARKRAVPLLIVARWKEQLGVEFQTICPLVSASVACTRTFEKGKGHNLSRSSLWFGAAEQCSGAQKN